MTLQFPTKEAMQVLIQHELKACTPDVRDAFVPFLVDPSAKILAWEYGELEQFPSWVFANLGERDVYAAYCVGGFGALGSPWGLVFGRSEAFGMDCGWFSSLQDLLLDWGFGSNV
jgi:hypothetical protein